MQPAHKKRFSVNHRLSAQTEGLGWIKIKLLYLQSRYYADNPSTEVQMRSYSLYYILYPFSFVMPRKHRGFLLLADKKHQKRNKLLFNFRKDQSGAKNHRFLVQPKKL